MPKTKSSKKTKQRTLVRKKILQSYTIWLPLLLVVPILLGVITVRNRTEITLPQPPADALYKQATMPIDARVTDLLGRMTLNEKIGQMALEDKKSLVKPQDIKTYALGGVLSGAGAKPQTNTPQGWLTMISELKQQARTSRLGIPILYGIDANHGNGNVPGSTVFPHAIGLGAANNPILTTKVAAATAQEIQATGANWSYSPSLDAPLDIRWGRVYEAFSDDPAINTRLGSAYIKGIQDDTPSGQQNVLATAKHYLATGSMQWDKSKNKNFKIDQGTIPARDELLDTYYLPPYTGAVRQNVASVMIGLDFWGTQRIADSKYLITDKLKSQLGFSGIVVTDWYGMYEFSGGSKYKATVQTINAGVDMAMLPFDYKNFIKDVRHAVERGDITQSRIDDAVSRILYQKFKAGLFDAQNTPTLETVGSETNRAVARQAVAESSVLLKNKGGLLPLPKNIGRIVVAGSGADNMGRQAGAWTVEWQGIDGNWLPGATSVFEGLQQVAGDSSTIDYKLKADFEPGTKADVAIAVVSEKPYAEGWGDNANPTLSGADKLAIERLQRITNNVIIVVLSGRPLLMTPQITSASAVVAAWLPGSEGQGIADVLFGNQPFTAKLPLPWPSTLAQVPTTYDGKSADGTTPLFERGYGLTNR